MSEEIKDEMLDNPLIVHHKDDASYQDNAAVIELTETHEEELGPTLERHRFKKDENKKSNKGLVCLVIVVILASVFCALYFTGNITFGNKENTSTTKQTTTETTTNLVEEYKGTIVVKNTYIFVDGIEVDGIDGLQKALKYADSDSGYRIINEDAQGDFFNYEVLPMLMQLGFYDESTEIEHKNLTGLMAKDELVDETTSAKKVSE